MHDEIASRKFYILPLENNTAHTFTHITSVKQPRMSFHFILFNLVQHR